MRFKFVALAAVAGMVLGVALSLTAPKQAVVHSQVRNIPELVVVPADGVSAMGAPRPITDPRAVAAGLVLGDHVLGDVVVWVEGEDLWVRWSSAPNIVMVGGHVCVSHEPFKDSIWRAPKECPYRLEHVSSIENFHELAIPLVVCCQQPGPLYVRAHALLLVNLRDRTALHVTVRYDR